MCKVIDEIYEFVDVVFLIWSICYVVVFNLFGVL